MIEGLDNDVGYDVRVRAYNSAGPGEWTRTVSETPRIIELWSATLTVGRYNNVYYGCDNSLQGFSSLHCTTRLTSSSFTDGDQTYNIDILSIQKTPGNLLSDLEIDFDRAISARLAGLNLCVGVTGRTGSYPLSDTREDNSERRWVGIGPDWSSGDRVELSIRSSCQFWRATLTPKALTAGLGCNRASATAANRCSDTATFTDDDFTLAGQPHTIDQIVLGPDGTLAVRLGSDIPNRLRAYTLWVGDTPFHFSAAAIDPSTPHTATWTETGLTWTAGRAVVMYLQPGPPLLSDIEFPTPTGARQVSLDGFPPGGGRNITARSSSDAVATVTVAADQSALTITPQGRGTATITVTATYRNGHRAISTFEVTVKTAPTVKARITHLRGVLGRTVSYDLHDYFEDLDGDPLTFQAVTVLTDRANFSVTPDGMLHITGTSQGSSTIEVTASDPDSNEVSQRVSLGVDGYVSWTAAQYRVGEDGAASALLKIRNEPARFSARIGMAWRPGTAAGGGVDYTKGGNTYTIRRTYSGAFPIAFTLVDDNLVENDETFTVTLTVPVNHIPGAGFSPGRHTTATVVIADDEAAEAKIAFGTDAASTSAHAVAVEEDVSAGTLSVPITVSHLPAASTTFAVEVLGTGTAAENTDYAIATKSVTFGPDDTSKTKNLEITITDDDGAERDETIKLRIVAADATPDDLGDHYDRHASGATATVTIGNDDGTVKTFAVSATATAAEGADATLTITLGENAPTGGVAFTVTAGYAGSSTASAADVGSFTSPVTVAENTDNLDITIPLVDDPVDEDDETFTITIAPASGVTGWVKEGDGKDQATVTITDNDTAGIRAGPGGPTSGTAPFNIARTRSRTYPVVLASKPVANVVVTPVSATPNNATVSGPMTFTPGNWNIHQHVTVTAHSRPNERGTALISHTVTSTDPKYPANMTLPRVEARIDAFPYVTMQNPTVTVTEPDGSATATTPVQAFISRDHQSYPGFALGFSLGAGTTATHHPTTCGPGIDFVFPFSVRASIPARFWGFSPVLNLTICGDDEHEDDEIIVLEILSQPASYQSAGKKTITITNNDRASMTVTPTSLLAVAGSTAAYTVVMDHQPAGDVTITATSGAEATATVRPANHTFTPANWNQAKTFTVTGAGEGTTAVSHAVTQTADTIQYPTTLDIDPVTVGIAPITVWSATLTPKTFVGAGLGCADGTSEKGCEPGELLTDDEVSVGGTDYGIKVFALETVGSDAGRLFVEFDRSLIDGSTGRLSNDLKDLVLRVDDRMFALTDATLANSTVPGDQLLWASTGLSWAADQKVLLSLVTQRWSATLAPRDLGGETVGCDNASSATGDKCSAASTLADDDFELGGVTYAITALRQTPAHRDTPRQLHVRLDPIPPDELNRYTLLVGRSELDIRDARRGADGALVWDDPAVTLAAGRATTLRLVDTGPGVKVSRAEVTMVGGAGTKATYTLVLNTAPAGDVVITPTSSATADATVSGALTFTPDNWDKPQTVTVTGVSDGAPTIAHAVTSTADTIQYPLGIDIDDLAVKVLNGYVSFESAAYSVRENRRQGALGHRGLLWFTLSHAPPSISYATFTWRDGTATGGGVDYTNGATRFGIAPRVKRSALGFQFVNDNLVEDDETFTVTITPPPGYEIGDHPTATFTIEDDEARSAKIAFGSDAASTSAYAVAVEEDVSAGTVSVPITVNHLPAASTTFTVEVIGGSATEDTDYTIATKSVTFGPDDTSKTQNLEISISDDDDTEIDETIRLRIVAADPTPDDLGDHYTRHAASSLATVTIGDDDGTPKTFAVSAAAAAAEGADATLTITLSENAPTGGVEFTITAGYAESSTASAADVGTVPSSVTVAPGQTTATVTVPLVDDDIDDDGETFTITVAPATGITGWVVASEGKDTATVTITDNDTAGITVSETNVSLTEAAGALNTATYTLVLDSEPTHDVEVAVSSGDAGAATVEPTSFTFTPATWSTAKTFTVTGVSDADAEDESVPVSHSATSSDSNYNGFSIGSVAVSVDDDEVKTFRISSTASAVEGESATLTVTLSAAAPASGVAFTITPGYSTTGSDNAVAADVGTVPGSVTVAAGETTATVTVPLATDDLDEDNETFTINISTSVSGWTKEGEGKDKATVTIVSSVASLSLLRVTVVDDAANTPLGLSSDALGTRFTAKVAHDVSAVKVLATPTVSGAAVSIGETTAVGKTLSKAVDVGFGDNEVAVVVTAPDGTTTRAYTLIVERAFPPVSVASVTAGPHSDGTPKLTVATTNPDAAVYDVVVQIKTDSGAWTARETSHSLPSGVSRDAASSSVSSHVFVGFPKATGYLVRAHVVAKSSSTVIAASSPQKAATTWGDPGAPGGPDAAVWSTTLTVDADSGSFGCDNAPGGLDDCLTGLGSDRFSFGGKSLRVTELFVDSSGNLNMAVATAGNVPQGLRTANLRIGGAAGTLYPMSSGFRKIYYWSNGPSWTDNQAITIELLAPSNNAAVTAGNEKLTVAWVEPADAGGRGATVTGYDVHYKTSAATNQAATVTDDPSTGWVPSSHTGTATTSEIARLTGGTAYDVRVRAKNAVGESSWITGSGTPLARTFSVTATASAVEGGSASLTITLSENAPAGGVSFTVTPQYTGTSTAVAADVGSITSPVVVAENTSSKAFTVPVVDDDLDESNETFQIVIATSNTGWVKSGAGTDTATVTITDNDTAGVTVTPTTLAIDEGASKTYTVVLDSQPTANVTLALTNSDTGAVTVSPTSHTFTATNWSTAQTFTVTGVEDNTDYDNESVTITHGLTSTDTKYAALTPDSVAVTVTDNDDLPVPVVASVRVGANPDGSPSLLFGYTNPDADVYEVVFQIKENSAEWTARGADRLVAAVVPGTKFLRTGLNKGTTYDVRAHLVVKSSRTVLEASSAVTTVTTWDDPDVVTGLDVTAGDAKLVLSWTAPTDTGGVSLSGYDIEYKTAAATNWTPQTHTSTGTTGEITSLTNDTDYDVRVRAKNAVGASSWITGSGTPTASSPEPTVTPKKLSFKRTEVSLSESRDGANHVVRIVRSGDISDEVSFTLTFADGTATVGSDYRGDQRTLKIEANKRHRDVLLRIVNDGIVEADDETFTVTLSPTTTGYTGGKALTVTIVDDDEVGVELSASELTVDEKETVTYKLKLTSKPTHDVTITATSGDASKVRLHRDETKTRTFTPENWNQYQKLTVRAKPIGDATVTITHAASSDDTAYDGVDIDSITVTVEDIVALPSAVIDLRYTLTGNSVTVTWTAPAAPNPVSRYYVRVMPTDSNTVAEAKERLRRPKPSETLSETFRNLVAGATYRISVRAVGPDHPGKGERTFTMEFTVPASPPPPE